MFLKRIEMQGFKSFADKTVIQFDQPLTGVVGPNGCGKSNISDAVRWVLGEQSAKSMRGEKMNDIIFAGSADRKKLNAAQVTLVFDNSNHILNSKQDEIEVTRKLYRDSGDAQYLINKKNVRLKDIVDLFLDTGLGRDSLSIISQGNVVAFADAKPQDRRGIFEEAAGVAKYKKKRMESIVRLQRTKDNLDRSNDILLELEKQVSPLKRQARKAEIYREKKARLEEIEISVLLQEIDEIKESIESAKKTLFDIDAEITMYQTNILVSENKIQENRNQASALDSQVNALQDAYMQVLNEIRSLEGRRTELDEKRKYIIESGNTQQKIQETKALLENARVEYEDRKQRLETLQTALKLETEKLSIATQKKLDIQTEYDTASVKLRNLENRKNVVEQLLRNPFNNQGGIKSIMDHAQSLSGIYGVVGQVLKAEEGYEEAISTALGGALNNIVTKDDQCAREAIRFLTRNQSGRATFLPLTVCQARWISRDVAIICNNVKGYLGVASTFVHNEPLFNPVVDSLLNNVLVCQDMESGNELSSLTKRQYKIVTLDGEVIHRGGSMTGGKSKHNANIMTMQKEADILAKDMEIQRNKVSLSLQSLRKSEQSLDEIRRSLQETRYSIAALEPVVDVKKDKFEKLKNDLALLGDTSDEIEDADSMEDTLIQDLNSAYSQRDTIINEMKSKREKRVSIMNDCERKEAQLRQVRKDLTTAEAGKNAINVDMGKLEIRLDTNIQRLASEYQLTYEFAKQKQVNVDIEDIVSAREEVTQLRNDIQHLGNINMNAPEEFNEVNTRYETLKQQIEELTLSRDKILAAIDEMDTVMKKQFKEMFDKINEAFNEIFTSLYGGGKARLILQDPEDLLNTGIDIDAQPPGKNVQNNMLFSGGEKSLIALCVLFAILKVKPVPLVILDEVEAALDPGNVERFAQYLHNYTDRTQFLVVTHRVGTMEKADVLYGVTMQHQGVSQMLKVSLRDAMNMADSTAGEE